MAIKVGDGILHCLVNSQFFRYGIVLAKSESAGCWIIKFCDGEEATYGREATNYYRNIYKKMVKDVTRNISSRDKCNSD